MIIAKCKSKFLYKINYFFFHNNLRISDSAHLIKSTLFHRNFGKWHKTSIDNYNLKSNLHELYYGIALVGTPIYCTYSSLQYMFGLHLYSFYSSIVTVLPVIAYLKYKGVNFSTLVLQEDIKSLTTKLYLLNEDQLKNEKKFETLNNKYQSSLNDTIAAEHRLNHLEDNLKQNIIALSTSKMQYENLCNERTNLEKLNELKCKTYEKELCSYKDEIEKCILSTQTLKSTIAEYETEKNKLTLNIAEINESLSFNLSELNNVKSQNISFKDQISYLHSIHEMQCEKYKSQVSVLNTNIDSLQKQFADREHQIGLLKGKIEEKDDQLKQLRSLEFRLDNIFDKVGLMSEDVGSLLENENKIQTSSKIGSDGEMFVSKIICEITTSFEHTGQNKASNRGDFIINNFGNNKMNVLIEVKNYENNIHIKNRDKFLNDLDFIENDDIHGGIFISLMSNITHEEPYKIQFSSGGKPYLCIFNFARFDNLSCCKHVLEACLHSLLYPYTLQQQTNCEPYAGKSLEEVYGRLKTIKVLALKNQGIKIKDMTQKMNDDIKDILKIVENNINK